MSSATIGNTIVYHTIVQVYNAIVIVNDNNSATSGKIGTFFNERKMLKLETHLLRQFYSIEKRLFEHELHIIFVCSCLLKDK